MATIDDIANSLEDMGATVNRATFAAKMQDPDYAENVRQSLSQGGATVPDSASFYNKYGKAAPAAQSGYAYNSPDDYTNLYNNAKLKGYSGLSDAEKDLFNKSFSASKAAQSGMTLEQAQAATDAGAQVPPPKESIINSIGKGIRTVTSVPVADLAAAVSGLQGAWNYDKSLTPDQSRLEYAWNQAKEEAPIARQKPITGEGIEGMLADPMLYAGLGYAGNAEAALGQGLSKIPVLLKYPMAQKIISNGLLGAGITGASEALNPSEQVDPVSIGIGGGIGVVAPTLGKLVEKGGLNLFPNKTAYENYLAEHGSTIESAPRDANQNISNLINQASGINPFKLPTQSNLAIANEANRVAAGEGMGKALSEAVGSRPQLSSNEEGIATLFNMPQKAESFKAPKLSQESPATTSYNEWGQQNINFPHGHSEYGEVPGLEEPTVYRTDRKGWFNENEWEDIKNKALDFYREQQRANPTAPSMKAVTKQINSRVEDLSAKTALRQPEYPAGSLVVGKYNPETGTVEQIPLPAIRSVEDVARQKHAVTSQFRPTNNKERAAMEADEAVHEAITRRLNEVPGYEEAAKPYTKQYKIAKSLANYVNKEPPNPRGFARQFPILANNYIGPSMIYKAGHTIGATKGLPIYAPELAQGLNTLYDRMKEQSKKSK